MRESPRSAKRRRDILSWARQGFMPIDEALNSVEGEGTGGPDALDKELGIESRDKYLSARRLKRIRQLFRRRESRHREG